MPFGDVANGQQTPPSGKGGFGSLTGPAGPTAPPEHHSGILGKIGHVLAKTVTGLADDGYNALPSVYQVAKTDAVVPWKNFITTGHPYQKGAGDKMDKLNDAIAEQTLRSLSDPHYMAQHPDQVLLNLLPATHAVGSLAARGGAAIDAAKAAEGSIVDRAGAAAKAAAVKPEIKPRLFQVGDAVRSLHPSSNPAVRAGQGVHDALLRRALEKNPDGRVAGYATRRLGGAGAETRRYQDAIRNAGAQLLGHTGHQLDDVEQSALRLTSEQTLPEEAIKLHQQQLEAGVNPEAQAKQIKLLTQVRERGIIRHDPSAPEGQQVQIDPDYAAGRRGRVLGVQVKGIGHRPDVAAVDDLLAKGGARRDQILTDTGQMSEGGIRERVDAPNRFVQGAHYEPPTPAKQGVVSPIMQRELDKLDQLHAQREKLHEADANWHATVPNRNLGPLSEADAKARLAHVDNTYEELIKTIIPEVHPYDAEAVASETRSRNTMRGRMDAGKKPSTGKSIEGRVGPTSKIKTVNQEVRDLAEQKLHDVIKAAPDHPVAKQAADLIAERDQLRSALQARTEHQMGIGDNAELPRLPEAPAWKHASVPLPANPYKDAITTTETLLDAQHAKVAKMAAAAAAREKPTGIVGGEDARAGRNYVPYYSSEPKVAAGTTSRTPTGVVGKVARIVSRNKPFTGEAKLQGEIPDNTTGLVARQLERANKLLANDTFRRDVSKSGSDTRQSRRDVLVNTQELLPVPRTGAEIADAKLHPEKYAQPVSDDIRALLGQRRMTLDELTGAAHGFEAFRQQLLPGLVKGSDHEALERTAGIGTPAPGGYKWVDRNLLAELGKPGAAPSGKIARAIDTTNAAQTAATVYFKLGHIATRVGTNAVAALIQGSLNPVAMTKAYNLWGDLEPLERVKAMAAAGEGGIHAMPAEALNAVGAVARSGALWWSKHFDAPFRFLSLAYQARKAGFTGAEGMRELLHQLEHGEKRAGGKLNAAEHAKADWVAKRANREAIAYDRLNEVERRYVRRAIWFYPWIKGASQFGLNTMLEHPYKTALLGHAAAEGKAEQERDLGPLPSYERGIFKVGGSADMPRVENIGTVSPFETPAEVLESIGHMNKPTESEELSAYLTPALARAAGLAFNLDANGRPIESKYGQPAKTKGTLANLAQGFTESTPEIALYKALASTPDNQAGKMFPNDPRLGLLRFFLGTVVPRPMNKGVANEAAQRDRAGAGR